MNKKEIRAAFRKAVFDRDKHRCVMCGKSSKEVKLNAHHIIDRHDLANGGYVPENGITLCDFDGGCHWKAEHWHATGEAIPDYSPHDLFVKIGSDLDKAMEASYDLEESLGEKIIKRLEEGVEGLKKGELKKTSIWRYNDES